MENHSFLCSHAQISFECKWRKRGWTCRSASLQPLPHEFRNHVGSLEGGSWGHRPDQRVGRWAQGIAEHLWCPQCKYQDAEIQLDPNVFCANTLRALPYWKCHLVAYFAFPKWWTKATWLKLSESGSMLHWRPPWLSTSSLRCRKSGGKPRLAWSTLLVAFRKQEMLPTWETMALQSSGWNGGFRGRVVAETLSKTTSCFAWRQRVAGFWSGPLRDWAERDFGQMGVQVASKKGAVEICLLQSLFCRYYDFESKQLWMNKVDGKTTNIKIFPKKIQKNISFTREIIFRTLTRTLFRILSL